MKITFNKSGKNSERCRRSRAISSNNKVNDSNNKVNART